MIAIFIYTLLFSIIGAVLIALSLRTESFDSVLNTIVSLSHSPNLRLGMALSGLLLILINISIARLGLRKLQNRKTIIFENPYGEVSLSLSAVEDHVRKLTNKMSEIKEIKSNITAGKAGIEVTARVALYSDVNIPEATEKIQNAIRSRLQEILGIEETVAIKVHVTKIVQREELYEQRDAVGDRGRVGFKGKIEYDR